MPVGKRTPSRRPEEKSGTVRTKRRTVAPSEENVESDDGLRPEPKQDLGVLMAQTLDSRYRASQALARLRSMHQTVVNAAAVGKSDIERKMESALEEYRNARFSALRARRQLLACLSSNETC